MSRFAKNTLIRQNFIFRNFQDKKILFLTNH
jgi:hypothetical protein